MNPKQAAALEQQINRKYSNTAGIIVLKDGLTRYEHYFNGCHAASRIHVYSVTKSIVSTLIGIALDKGYIQSIHQKVLDFFPDYPVKRREQTIRDITLQHLLTMTAPFKYRLAGPYIKYFASEDWVQFSLDVLGGRGRTGKFRYTPLIGPDILSGIVVRATGQTLLDFAAKHLFSPLGVTVEHPITFQSKEEQLAFNQATNISGWAADGTGIHAGGWGLTLSPVDMAKIGQLYLDGGQWKGQQVVSPDWIAESTKPHSRWEKRKLSYGYLWWVNDGDSYAAMGDGGNVIYVNPESRLVVAIASLFVPKAKDRLAFIQEYIEPMLEHGV